MRNLFVFLFFFALSSQILAWHSCADYVADINEKPLDIGSALNFRSHLLDSEALTTEMWVKLDGGQFAGLFGTSYAWKYNFGLFKEPSQNNFYSHYDGGCLYSTATVHSIGKAINYNEWFHIALVHQGKNQKIQWYFNGELFKEDDQNCDNVFIALVPQESIRVLLGGWKSEPGGWELFLKGKMSDVRVWKTARTAQEIQENMLKRLTGNEAGLIAYYPLNEGSGLVINDLSDTVGAGSIQEDQWVADCDLGLASAGCQVGKYAHAGECVDSCPSPFYGDQSGDKWVCVNSCPTCTVIDNVDKVCRARGAPQHPFYNIDKTDKGVNIDRSQTPFYDAPDVVCVDQKCYQCKGWPYNGWCKQKVYQPGCEKPGSFWQNAWTDVTGLRYQPTSCKYNNWHTYVKDQNYQQGDIVWQSSDNKFYQCLCEPFAPFCDQAAYEPGKSDNYWLSAWENIPDEQIAQVINRVGDSDLAMKESFSTSSLNQKSAAPQTETWKDSMIIVLSVFLLIALLVAGAAVAAILIKTKSMLNSKSSQIHQSYEQQQIMTADNLNTNQNLKA